MCPVVLEPNGKLKDKVRVNGRVEVHSEGVYFIEWRENGKRLREAVRDRSEVRERARLKKLEINAREAGIEVASPGPARASALATDVAPAECPLPNVANIMDIQQLVYGAIDTYFRNLFGGLVSAHAGDAHSTDHASVPLRVPPLQRGAYYVGRPQHAGDQAPLNDHHNKVLLAEAIDAFLKDIEPPQREPKTYHEYRSVLYRLRDNCSKKYVQDITREDCLEFMRHLYSIGNEPRTVSNRIGIVLQLLRLHGITGLLQRQDKPKYVETIREMYQPEDLEALFKVCTPEEKVRYLFFLLTGERDKEVRYTTWADIDFNRKCVRVTAKKQLGFKPKDKEEREIPIPEALVDALKQHKSRQSGPNRYDLVLPTREGRPDKKFENKLKRIAARSGLNCGRCVSKYNNKCTEGPYCGKWFLHKFRHTFATMCLENGVSIRTLQTWLGHSDLEATMVYLKFVRRKDIHKLLDNSELAGVAAVALEMRASDNGQDLPQPAQVQ